MAMGLLLALLYFVACEWLFGATPGNFVCGLRVVMDDGSPCTLKAALIRGVVRFFDGLLFGLPAYLAMKPQEYRRAGDDLAHTLVVKASDLTPGRLRSKWRLLVALAVYMFVATSICGWYLMVLFIRG